MNGEHNHSTTELVARLATFGYTEPVGSVALVERLVGDLADAVLKHSRLLKRHERGLALLEQRQLQIQQLKFRARSPSPVGDQRSAAALLTELDALSQELHVEQQRQIVLAKENQELACRVEELEQRQRSTSPERAELPHFGKHEHSVHSSDQAQAAELQMEKLKAKVCLLENHLRNERGKKSALQEAKDALSRKVHLLEQEIEKLRSQQQQRDVDNTSTTAATTDPSLPGTNDSMWLGVFQSPPQSTEELYRKIETLEQALQNEHLLKCETATNLEVAVQQAQAQRQQLELQLRKAQESAKEQREETECLRAALQRAESSASARRDQCSILQGRVEMIAKNQVDVSIAEEEKRQRLQAELYATQTDLIRQRDLASAAEAAREDAEIRAATFQSALQHQQVQLAAVEKDLVRFREEQQAASQALEKLRSGTEAQNLTELSTNLACLRADHTSLLQQNSVVKEQLQDALAQTRTAEEANSNLSEKLEKLQNRITELETANAALKEQHSKLLIENSHIKKVLNKATVELATAQATSQGLKAAVETLEDRIHFAEEERDQGALEAEALRNDLSKARTRMAATSHRLEQYRKAFQPMQATCSKLRQQLKDKNESTAALLLTSGDHNGSGPQTAPSVLQIAVEGDELNEFEEEIENSTIERTVLSRWFTPLPIKKDYGSRGTQ